MKTGKKTMQKKGAGFGLFLTAPILAWALYDFANTIFSSNMITIFFPFYLQETIGDSARMDQIASTFISYANALASFFLVIFTPLYGVLIDRTGKKKRYITVFTLICIVCTFLMGIIAGIDISSEWFGLPVSLLVVVTLFVIAKFFYHSSLVFYDTILPDLGTKDEIPLISGFGIAVGYLGTLVGLSVYLLIGNDQFHEAFIPTALLFFLFFLPFLFFVKDPHPLPQQEKKASFFSGYKEIIRTFKEMKHYKPAFIFMIAFFFMNDALQTAIAMMAVYAKIIIGFTAGQFILLYLVSTISSIIGSFLFGYITKAIGAKRSITVVYVILIVALILAVTAATEWVFWVAGSLFGISLGASWGASRILIIELTPKEKRGQFFGLFAFSGKVSSIIGPIIYGSVTLLFAEHGNLASRLALGSLLILAAIGLVIHQFVREKA
ncbi:MULTISPECIES: MFS transporter [Bacillus]|uniref:MFS transporter n=1 Tax=Bacillus TaxID=1386 RepID=UPI0007176D5F|nr:MFS transporter [Bacillus pumilus]KRU16924.1 MFS transporter [Bacillus pumilus]MCY7679480.1 MFS transporter [Bacillus pumilus]MCY9673779.1 MFS transporter [Bacillus pumilus]